MITFQIYRQKSRTGHGDWRWRAKSNGRIIADSGEGYKRRGPLLSTVKRIIRDCAAGNYLVE